MFVADTPSDRQLWVGAIRRQILRFHDVDLAEALVSANEERFRNALIDAELVGLNNDVIERGWRCLSEPNGMKQEVEQFTARLREESMQHKPVTPKESPNHAKSRTIATSAADLKGGLFTQAFNANLEQLASPKTRASLPPRKTPTTDDFPKKAEDTYRPLTTPKNTMRVPQLFKGRDRAQTDKKRISLLDQWAPLSPSFADIFPDRSTNTEQPTERTSGAFQSSNPLLSR